MIKRLSQSIREYKRATILTPLFVVLEVFMDVLLPMLMAKIIDVGLRNSDIRYVAKIGLVLLAVALVALLAGILSGHFAAIASAGFAHNLRQDMFYSIQNFSFSNIDKFSTASLVTRMTTDVTRLQNAYQMCTRIAVRAPIMLLSAGFMALRISGKLSMVFLLTMPILLGGITLIMSKANPRFRTAFKQYDVLNAVVQENLTAVRTVKAYVREDFEKEKFGRASTLLQQLLTAAEKVVILGQPLMQFCMYTTLLLVSWVGAHIVVGGSMTTGQLMSMFTYTTQILSSLMMLSMVFMMLIMSRASAERVVEVLEEQSDIVDGAAGVSTVADGSIDFEGVDFSYSNDPEKLALEGIDLHIRSGETIGIIGGTGSSKTTLVQLIPRLYDATAGTVRVGGVDVKDYDLEALRDGVAVVLQKNTLFSGTIAENLRWGNPNATDEEIVHAAKLAQADEFVQAFPNGYDTVLDQGGTNVSGGQKQRLCIARALLKKPKILILDDSTSAVDTKTDAFIRQAFREELPGTTKIIIAQRISSVEDADRIIVLDNGKVDAFDTPQALLEHNAIYREVYQSQVKGDDENA